MRKIVLLTIIVLTFWGCAGFSRSYKLGNEAALGKNWDAAVKYYEKAALENPDNSVYRLALFRAKLAASAVHLIKARGLVFQGERRKLLLSMKKPFPMIL